MHQPLGRSIGTGIEIIEAREFLRNRGDARPRELVVAIAAALVAETGADEPDALVRSALESGSGYSKFLEMIEAQGGDVAAFERMKTGDEVRIVATQSGHVRAMDVVALGHMGRALSTHDATGGLWIHVRLGDYVEAGTPLLSAFGTDRERAHSLTGAVTISHEPFEPPALIYDVLCNDVAPRYERSISEMM